VILAGVGIASGVFLAAAAWVLFGNDVRRARKRARYGGFIR
jgi:hypothetical protein